MHHLSQSFLVSNFSQLLKMSATSTSWLKFWTKKMSYGSIAVASGWSVPSWLSLHSERFAKVSRLFIVLKSCTVIWSQRTCFFQTIWAEWFWLILDQRRTWVSRRLGMLRLIKILAGTIIGTSLARLSTWRLNALGIRGQRKLAMFGVLDVFCTNWSLATYLSEVTQTI